MPEIFVPAVVKKNTAMHGCLSVITEVGSYLCIDLATRRMELLECAGCGTMMHVLIVRDIHGLAIPFECVEIVQ